MPLTGRFTFRRSMMGKIVLQIEEEVKTAWPFSRRSPSRRRWRDATLMDLAQPEMRALVDLRYKPQFMPQSFYAQPETSQEKAGAPLGVEAYPEPAASERGRFTAH